VSRTLWIALTLAAAACGKKAPPAADAEPTVLPPPPVGHPELPDDAGPAPSAAPAPMGPIVTPKTAEELGARVVEALVAKDVGRLAAYVPSAGFLERHCPEMAPAMRQGYTDKIVRSLEAARTAGSKCHELDWTGATLVSAERKAGDKVDFYGCPNVADDRVTFTIAVGDTRHQVEMVSMLVAPDAFFVGAPLTCTVPTPCAAIVKHLEDLVAADPSATEVAPLPDDKRGGVVVWCEGLWDFPDKRTRLACMRDATTYAGLMRCGEPLGALFTTWPRK
jgi:hypothetical protein